MKVARADCGTRCEAPTCNVCSVASFTSITRFARRTATAPWLIEDTRTVVAQVRGELDQLRKQVEATGQTQLEALVLLTRAVDELNTRLQQLEDRPQPPEA